MVHVNTLKNLRPITTESHPEMIRLREEKRERGKELVFNRSNLIKEIFSRPLAEIASYSKEFKKIIQTRFENIDEITVFEAVQLSTVMRYLIKGDPRDYSNLMDNSFGKLKEETERKTIEIPVFEDPISLIHKMSDTELKLLFGSIQHRLTDSENKDNTNLI